MRLYFNFFNIITFDFNNLIEIDKAESCQQFFFFQLYYHKIN